MKGHRQDTRVPKGHMTSQEKRKDSKPICHVQHTLSDDHHHKGNVKISHLGILQTGDSMVSEDVASQPNGYCQTGKSPSFLPAAYACYSPSNALSRPLCKSL